MSFNYPVNPTKEQKEHYRTFILSLRHTLPCGACRDNLEKNLKKIRLTPHALKNRNTFSRWLYRLHEEINTMLNKKSGLSYNDVRYRYEKFRAKCNEVTTDKLKIEKGCNEPINRIKSKCVISIVPKETQCMTFNIHKDCV